MYPYTEQKTLIFTATEDDWAHNALKKLLDTHCKGGWFLSQTIATYTDKGTLDCAVLVLHKHSPRQ
jgi:hypothetical protein